MKIHHSVEHGESLALEETECDNCGFPFSYYPSEKRGRFCSDCIDEVHWGGCGGHGPGKENPNWNRKEVTCDYCRTAILRTPSSLEGKRNVFCNEECRRKWDSEVRVGERHHNYIEGRHRGSYGLGWSQAKRKALERDNYKCQSCGDGVEEIGRNPDVHHIEPVEAFDDISDAHFLDNLVCLCPSCHRNVEEGNLELE